MPQKTKIIWLVKGKSVFLQRDNDCGLERINDLI
jgi:hypothetical protein